MKKLIFLTIILFIGIVLLKINENNNKNYEEKGVFISYIDYQILKNKTAFETEKIIEDMVSNISYLGLNTIILQVSAFNDSIYYSDIYKSSKVVVEKEGDELPLDILNCFIEKAKLKNIKVYAWINPFRIRNKNDISDINKDSYYYKWLDTDNIERSENGIFLNPASSEVIDYITLIIEELIKNYDIKAVLFDDYYYPSETIDLKTYEESDKKVSLKEYRINNINKLIEKSYKKVKSSNPNIKFGLSPSGNIENNLEKEYLDIESILNKDYIDFVIPQLYYGFNNTNKPYLDTLKKWESISNNKDLYLALALYKSGKQDAFALNGKNEWIENSDIIKKQIIAGRNVKNYKGFFIYRYEFLFNKLDNDILDKEIDNLKTITVN